MRCKYKHFLFVARGFEFFLVVRCSGRRFEVGGLRWQVSFDTIKNGRDALVKEKDVRIYENSHDSWLAYLSVR